MDIADARYVSLITYRRSGEAVPVPVWIAPLADGRAGFTTDGSSGKVKRIRNNPSVTLKVCDMRGNVADDAVEVAATAAVAPDGADYEAVRSAVGKKYGIQFTATEIGGKLKRLVSKGSSPVVAVVITFPA